MGREEMKGRGRRGGRRGHSGKRGSEVREEMKAGEGRRRGACLPQPRAFQIFLFFSSFLFYSRYFSRERKDRYCSYSHGLSTPGMQPVTRATPAFGGPGTAGGSGKGVKEEQTQLNAVPQPDLLEGRQVGPTQPLLTQEHIESLAPWGDPKGQEELARSFRLVHKLLADPSHRPLTWTPYSVN